MANPFLDGLSGLFQNAGPIATAVSGGNPVVGAIASGLGSMFGGIFGSESQNASSVKQFRYQNALLDKQNAFNEYMFDRQLQANKDSIKDQFNAYRELGVNPLSMNLQQTPMASLQSGSPAPSAPLQSPVEVAQTNALNSEANLNNAKAGAVASEVEVNKTQSFLNTSQADQINQLKDGLIKLQDGNLKLMQSISDLNKGSLRQIEASIRKLDAEVRSLTVGLDGIRQNNKIAWISANNLQEQFNWQFKQYESTIGRNSFLNKNDARLTLWQINKWISDIATNTSQQNLNNELGSLYAAQAEGHRQLNWETLMTQPLRIRLQNNIYEFQIHQNEVGRFVLDTDFNAKYSAPDWWRIGISRISDVTGCLNFSLGSHFGWNFNSSNINSSNYNNNNTNSNSHVTFHNDNGVPQRVKGFTSD